MKLLVPPPLVGLICGAIMWAIASYWPEMRFNFPLQNVLAFALIACGVAIDLVSVFAFYRAKTTVTPLAPQKASTLVVTGFYRFTRNPMYLGMLFILCGIAVWIGSPINVAVAITLFAYITTFQIRPEEDRLIEVFGDEYRAYMMQVRRWL